MSPDINARQRNEQEYPQAIAGTTRSLSQREGKSAWNGLENSSAFLRSKGFSQRVAGSVGQVLGQATQPKAATGALRRSPDKKQREFLASECGAGLYGRLPSASMCRKLRHKSRNWRARWKRRIPRSYRAFRHEGIEERVLPEPGNSNQGARDRV